MRYPIRKARLTDAEQLVLIEKSAAQAFLSLPDLSWIAHSSTLSAEQHREIIRHDDAFVATDEHDQPVAFIHAKKYDRDLYIAEMDVTQSYQQQGIGKQLLLHLIDIARNSNIKSVTLTTFVDVKWNSAFYQTLGFTLLTDSNIPDYLHDILHHEINDNGFPANKRCAMLLTI